MFREVNIDTISYCTALNAMYTYVRTHVHTYACVRMYVCMYVCTYAYVHMHVYVRMYVCTVRIQQGVTYTRGVIIRKSRRGSLLHCMPSELILMSIYERSRYSQWRLIEYAVCMQLTKAYEVKIP